MYGFKKIENGTDGAWVTLNFYIPDRDWTLSLFWACGDLWGEVNGWKSFRVGFLWLGVTTSHIPASPLSHSVWLLGVKDLDAKMRGKWLLRIVLRCTLIVWLGMRERGRGG